MHRRFPRPWLIVGAVAVCLLALTAIWRLRGHDAADLVVEQVVPSPTGTGSAPATPSATGSPAVTASPSPSGSSPRVSAPAGGRPSGPSPAARARAGGSTTATSTRTTATGTRTAATRTGTGTGTDQVTASGKPPIPVTAQQGKATYYGADGVSGACMPVTTSPTGYTVAVGPAEYADGRACGSYVKVTGAKGTILAKVDDLCPECDRGHLDLSREAFAAIDDPVKGIVPITYRGVRDPSVPPIVLKVKDGSSRWWLGLHVDNAGNPLAVVEVATSGGSWRPTTRQTSGFWTHESDLGGEAPFRVRVTDIYGHRVTLTGVRLAVGEVQRTGASLY